MHTHNLAEFDHEIKKAIDSEFSRQQNVIEMIASENIVSPAVREAVGSVLTNKYSEGYPSKRYYGGNEFIDICEELAIERAKRLFGAEHANVQPHSGSSANMEAYLALLKLGDTVLAMSLDHGGHLTHGHMASASGKFYNFVHYGVDSQTEMIDMDDVRALAKTHRPKLILAGASAYSRFLDFKEFRSVADEVGAYLMVDMAHIAGPIAAKLHPDPVPHADVITTTTHKTLRGPRGAIILSKTDDRLDPDAKRNLARRIDSAVFPGMQGGPLDHVIAGKAVALKEALQPDFIEYQKQTLANAKALADELTAGGLRIVSGGTDNHLVLVDMTLLGISGGTAELALEDAGICCNKNMVPNDPRKPMDPSGIRLGTPALTTRGMAEDDVRQIAQWIMRVCKSPGDDAIKKSIRQEVIELCARHPLA